MRILQCGAEMDGAEKRLSHKGISKVKGGNQCKKNRDQREQRGEPGFFGLHPRRLRDSAGGVKPRSI